MNLLKMMNAGRLSLSAKLTDILEINAYCFYCVPVVFTEYDAMLVCFTDFTFNEFRTN